MWPLYVAKWNYAKMLLRLKYDFIFSRICESVGVANYYRNKIPTLQTVSSSLLAANPLTVLIRL